ncbi:MAG: hypothetical protein ACR2N3_02580 [Pyrinomonadaceae bacterium]
MPFLTMPENNAIDKNTPTIADLYPELSPEQQAAAEFYLSGYLDVVRRIFERISIEQPELLTKLEKPAILRQDKSLPDSTDKL